MRKRRLRSDRAWRAAVAPLVLAGVVASPAPDLAGEQPSPATREESAEGEGPVETPPRLEERVEVEARLDDALETVAATTRLDATDLAARGADVADLLRGVPGARVRDYGGLGSYAVASLRASTAQQVRVRVDGVPWGSAWGGAVDLGLLPAADLERVTVYRGFSPAGAGAFGAGGLVDLRTRDAAAGARAGLLVGELGTRRLHASAALPWGDGAVRVGVAALDGDGDLVYRGGTATPFDPSDDRLRRRRNNAVEQRSFFARGRRGGWRWSARHDRTARGVAPAVEIPDPRARTETERSELALTWERPTPERPGSWRVDGFLRRLDDAFVDPGGDFGRPRDRAARANGGGLTLTRRLLVGGDPLLLRAEAELDRVRVDDAVFDASDRGGARRRAAAIAAEWVRVRGPWTTTAALRLDRIEDDFLAGEGPVPPPADDAAESAASGKVGVARRVGENHLLRATAGRGFRRPALLELFGDGGALRGNPQLASETADGLEVGWSWDAGDGAARAGRVHVETFAFLRDVDDLIRFLPVGQAAVAANVAGARVSGVELAVGARPFRGARVDLTVTRQRAVDASGGPADGRRLVYQPDWLGSLSAGLRRGRLDARWDLTWTGENPTDTLDTPELRIDDRLVHDVALDWRLGGGLRATLDVRNVFDRRVIDVLRYPLPGRVVLAGLSWTEATP